MDERNSTAKKLVETTNDLNNTAAERIRLEKLGAELAAKAVKLSEALKYAQISLDNFKKVPPAGLSGLVTAVPLPDVVEISLGADDGVSVGNRFNVTRPSANKYIGVIEVIKVDYPNRAVCRPDTKLQSDQIQKGDHVEADHQNPLRRPLPWQRPKQRRRNTANRGPMSTRSCWWSRC